MRDYGIFLDEGDLPVGFICRDVQQQRVIACDLIRTMRDTEQEHER